MPDHRCKHVLVSNDDRTKIGWNPEYLSSKATAHSPKRRSPRLILLPLQYPLNLPPPHPHIPPIKQQQTHRVLQDLRKRHILCVRFPTSLVSQLPHQTSPRSQNILLTSPQRPYTSPAPRQPAHYTTPSPPAQSPTSAPTPPFHPYSLKHS